MRSLFCNQVLLYEGNAWQNRRPPCNLTFDNLVHCFEKMAMKVCRICAIFDSCGWVDANDPGHNHSIRCEVGIEMCVGWERGAPNSCQLMTGASCASVIAAEAIIII